MRRTEDTRIHIDARGKEICLPPRPERIISFICSVTETLFELGLGDRVLGRTNYCIRPAPAVEEVQKIGGPKDPDNELIISMKPDLVIANIEENEKNDIDILENSGIPVYVNYPKTVIESREMIRILGEITGTEDKAENIYEKAGREITAISEKVQMMSEKPRIVYLIWRKPYMTINHDTYINDIIEFCGGINQFADSGLRYPVISMEDIIDKKPDIIFFPSEPFPFKKKHTEEFYENNQIPSATLNGLRLVDGEMFSWYGYRMIMGLRYTFEAIHNYSPDNS